MSSTIHIDSAEQFNELLGSSKIIVADFYADWCAPCKAIAPIFEQLSEQMSKPNAVTFVKIHVQKTRDISKAYAIACIPTFIMFRDGKVAEKVEGADQLKLRELVRKISQESESAGAASGSSSSNAAAAATGSSALGWRGAELPRGYTDVTDQVEIPRTELLNFDEDFGSVRTLLDTRKPGALDKKAEKDWVVSDTDEQLLIFAPFMSMLKLHTLQITSIADEDEDIMRPKVIKLFTNRPHNLGFDDAEGETPTQMIELGEKDWDAKTSTANIPLRFVKFQNINSLVIFVESGDGQGEKTRIDRIRFIGETGEKREMGKLEKIGDDQA